MTRLTAHANNGPKPHHNTQTTPQATSPAWTPPCTPRWSCCSRTTTGSWCSSARRPTSFGSGCVRTYVRGAMSIGRVQFHLTNTTRRTFHPPKQVQSAQEVFAINVDLHRNRVLRTTLLLTMLSTSFASAATVASFFGGRFGLERGTLWTHRIRPTVAHHTTLNTGMNVMNGLEVHPEAFQYLVQASCALGVSLFLTSFGLVRCVPSGWCLSALHSFLTESGFPRTRDTGARARTACGRT